MITSSEDKKSNTNYFEIIIILSIHYSANKKQRRHRFHKESHFKISF